LLDAAMLVPAKRRPPFHMILVGIAAAAVFSTFLALCALGIKRLSVPPTGSMVVTVSGPRGKPITELSVSADGKLFCDQSPCRIPDLKPGAHFVQVEAKGFGTSALRAVVVQSDQEATTHVELAPDDRQR
jgi:hypothetical protein